ARTVRSLWFHEFGQCRAFSIRSLIPRVRASQAPRDKQMEGKNREEVAFSNWINSNLSMDPDLKRLLPVIPEGNDLYTKVQDGLII
ncbi:hypothetical protein ANCDUO_26079, partial [Ancylostoma duodenale]